MPILITLRMRLPVWPFQSPLRTPIGERGHLVEHGMNLGHDVLAVMDDRSAARRAQGDVQHRALLGGVDLLAAEHGVDALAQARLLGELQQQGQGFVGDAVLGIVEIDSGGFGHEPLAAPAILGEELPQLGAPDLLVMLLQQRPGRAQVQSRYAH